MFPNPYRYEGDSSFPFSENPTSPSSQNTTITPLFANARLLDTGKAAPVTKVVSYYCLLHQSHPDGFTFPNLSLSHTFCLPACHQPQIPFSAFYEQDSSMLDVGSERNFTGNHSPYWSESASPFVLSETIWSMSAGDFAVYAFFFWWNEIN